ncbi:MAG: YedE family putative selenium transporter [Atopobiaceae bacterium]|jgi:YedE family putative selenium metabolism protein
MNKSKEKVAIICGGAIIGVIAALLVFFGNPRNMGFCIACFIRDTVGALGLDSAAAVQYIRPEVIGLILGSTIMAVVFKEYSPRGGSAPVTRFVLGFFAMIGALMFLGCPFRMILRLAGGDLNAVFGLVGFTAGILAGVFFLNRGYSLSRSHKMSVIEGSFIPVIAIVLLVLLIAAPEFIHFTESGKGPGALHAALGISLAAGLVVGAIAQRTRMCMVGGIRDAVLFKDNKLLLGFVAVFVAALITNIVMTQATGTTYFQLGFAEQPIAHTDGLWNALGTFLLGFASVLLGGCPLRQTILSGEGNSDSAITILGLAAGAAFAHNFGLASSGAGPTMNGQIAVIIGIVVVACIACANTFAKAK